MEDDIMHLEHQHDGQPNSEAEASIPDAPATRSMLDFELLFHQFYNYLCLTATAILHDTVIAEDIVQEFYISYWNKQQDRLTPAAFRAYAKRAITNDCIDYLRKQNVIEKNIAGFKTELSNDPETEAEQFELSQSRQQKILDLVAQLPNSRKQILLLHAVEKLSYAQIAAKQGVSINTVRTQLSRAYKSLRSQASLILMYFFKKF